MKNLKLTKIIASTLVVASVLALNPIGASASWRQDSNGWWNTEGSSWSVGWRNIDKKWYYFNSNGYMAHDTIADGYKLGSDGSWIQNNTVNNNGYNQTIVTTALADLVTAGTITSTEETAIETAITSANGNITTALANLVTAGTITSTQETAIKTALAKQGGEHKDMFTAKLADLVTAGTITADEETAIETAITSANGNITTALANLVTAGTITSDQENTIETALSSQGGFKTTNTNILNNSGRVNKWDNNNWHNNWGNNK